MHPFDRSLPRRERERQGLLPPQQRTSTQLPPSMSMSMQVLQLIKSKGLQPKIAYDGFVYRLRRSGMTASGETYYFHCDKGRRRAADNPRKKVTVRLSVCTCHHQNSV